MSKPLASYLVLDFKKEDESAGCMQSIREHSKFPHQIIYLDNGSNENYPWKLYQAGLCDVLISKKKGMGGGYGQTDLVRYCDTDYFFFVQNDQVLARDITEENINWFSQLLNSNYHCIDLNGDQSRRGIWTDRAHFMKTSVFNDLGPFPNGGPGNDSVPWNEQYLQQKFVEKKYRIAHVNNIFFLDCGKWSIREAGDGLYKHRCDTKEMYILKYPTFKTDTYPPFTEEEWKTVLEKKWIDGTVPIAWKNHSFKFWN